MGLNGYKNVNIVSPDKNMHSIYMKTKYHLKWIILSTDFSGDRIASQELKFEDQISNALNFISEVAVR